MRALLCALALALALPHAAVAQSSQFGTNGLGITGRALSVRSLGSGGGYAPFDAGSTLNPASIAEYTRLTASVMLAQTYRSSSTATQSVTGRDTRFPLFAVTGPVPGSPLSVGASFTNYTDRDFAVASTDTLLLRGEDVVVHDTLTSRGGISDLRLAAAWRRPGTAIGAALHVITGSARVSLARAFEDSAYAPIGQRAEISYAGVGVSLGATRVLRPNLALAAFVRADGSVDVDRDSTSVGSVNLPVTVGGGVRWRPMSRLDAAASVVGRTWSAADDDIRALGGTGADNTLEVSGGFEWTRNPRTPATLPLRVGAHTRTLAFRTEAGSQPSERGVSLGTGMAFARDPQTFVPRAQVDLSVSHLWRSAEGGYSETAWLIAVGVNVRP